MHLGSLPWREATPQRSLKHPGAVGWGLSCFCCAILSGECPNPQPAEEGFLGATGEKKPEKTTSLQCLCGESRLWPSWGWVHTGDSPSSALICSCPSRVMQGVCVPPWQEPGCQTWLCFTHGPVHAWLPLQEQRCGWPASLPVAVVPLVTWGILVAVVPLASPHPQPSPCQHEAGSAHRCCPHLPAGPACGQLAVLG